MDDAMNDDGQENKITESDKDDDMDKKDSKLNIDPDKVIDYLKEFYEEKKKNSKNENLS